MLKTIFKNLPVGILLLVTISMMMCCEQIGIVQPLESQVEDEFEGLVKVGWEVYGILRPDHSLWLWGKNDFGTLGNGTTVSSEFPLRVELDNVIDFDLIQRHIVAIDSAGDIWYWGLYLLGGSGPMLLEPLKISHIDQAIDVQFSGPEIHVLSQEGTIWKVEVKTKWIEPELLTTIPAAKALTETIVLLENGTLQSYQPLEASKGGLLSPINDVVSVKTAPGYKTLIAKEDGTVWNWGYIIQPDKSYQNFVTPIVVTGVDNIIAVELSETSSTGGNVALCEDGTLWFWGRYHPTPTPVINNVKKMAINYTSGPYENILLQKNDGTYWLLPINYVEFNVEEPIPVIWE